jgi:hypothetical protein
MSPLSRFLMQALRYACWASAGVIVLFAGIFLYQRWGGRGIRFYSGDLSLLVVLAVLFLLAIYLVRALSSELNRPGT